MPLGTKGKAKLNGLFEKTEQTIPSDNTINPPSMGDKSLQPELFKEKSSSFGKRRGFYLPNDLSRRLDIYVSAYNLINGNRIKINDVVKKALDLYLSEQERTNVELKTIIEKLNT